MSEAAHEMSALASRAFRLLQVTAVAANQATTVEEAMKACIDAVCGECGWPVGHFYLPASDGAELSSSSVWHLDDPSRFEAFRRTTEALRLRRGQGLPGRVLAFGRPAWIADLAADLDFSRLAAAAEAGLASAFAFPVLAGTEVVGVLEFFHGAPAEPDPALLEVMSQIGTQLGRVVERTRAADALRESEERMRLVIETAGDAFVGMDASGTITHWNQAAVRTFGWPAAEAVGRRLSETIIPERYREAHEAGLARFMASGEAVVFGNRLELEALHHDGHEVPMELSIWPVGQGSSVRFNAFVHDITERRNAQAELREAKERFQRAFDDAPIGMGLIDLGGKILQANRAYCEMLGYTKDALLAMSVIDLTHPDDLESSHEHLRRAASGEIAGYRMEKRYIHGDGHPVWVVLNVSAVTGPGGETYFIGQIEDVSLRKEAEEYLTRQALHDPLTGLPNRSLMLDRLRQALARSEREPGGVTVMFVDLDNFKLVNDSLGHEAGDQVLSSVAQRIQAAVRPTDTVCRLGGDEFVIVCEGLDGEAAAKVMATRVVEAVRQPCALREGIATVTASVGLAMTGAGPQAPDALLRSADAAMYRAKEGGKARHEVFGDDLRLRAAERLRLEGGLREAFQAGRLRLFYQPIVELDGGAMACAEAHLLYEDPERGLLTAGEFIDVAEDSGLIIPLGAWVLEKACQDAAGWHRRGCRTPVTVNLGPRQMARPDLVSNVRAALDAAGLAPEALWLDLPETALTEAAGSTLKDLFALQSTGVRLGVNDWGTGPTSMSALRSVPVDYLKIDGSLVAGVGSDWARTATVTAMVGAGRAFELTTVAKGVDNAEQLGLLRGLGCTLGQGKHLSPAQPPEALSQQDGAGQPSGNDAGP